MYPQLVPLCSLDALCLSTLSGAVMAHFDAGGVLDTSLPLTPLREMLGHSVVEMGPAAVRVQAALEVAVYTSVMSPPNNSGGVLSRCLLELKCWNAPPPWWFMCRGCSLW